MKYSLAKQLKDAGLPQGFADRANCIALSDGTYTTGDLPFSSSLQAAHVPTLEELIEACGEHFRTLVKCSCNVCKWNCHGDIQGPHQPPYEDDDWARGFNGMTPTEAVAMLYVALHGNKRGATPPMEGN